MTICTSAGTVIPRPRHMGAAFLAAVLLGLAFASPARAQSLERLCDNSFEDCRTPIIQMIQRENVGLDVSFWFMTDTRYSTEIIRRWQAGVPVRILLDLRADTNYPANANVRQSFINAGIPIRRKTTTGINHWKMILYAGQSSVHFTAANFANGSYSPVTPYTGYVDEAIYFTNDPDVVHTFMKKYDDHWTDTTHYANLANVPSVLTRNYPTYPMDPELNFTPEQDYMDRLIAAMRQETQQIDVVMFRITSGKVPDEMIRRAQLGVPIRLITDQRQYRNPTYFWHSYNIDRMFVAGIPIKWKEDTTDQDVHQKSVVLHGQDMAIFGSSNWTTSSSDTQREHNYFTRKPWFVDWFAAQFLRKWNNQKIDGTPITPTMFLNYTPGWPETPVNISPANEALGLGTSVALRWEGGWWAHKYDIYFGTTNPPPLVATDYMPGSATAGTIGNKESFNPCTPPSPFVSACPSGLAAGTTYYWRVRGKTMLGNTRAISGPIWSFTTSGGVPPPLAPTNLQATPVSTTRIDLSWTDVADEAGYKVERKLASASSTAWAQIGTTGADVSTYQDTSGLTAGTSYNYRVRAWTTGGNSAYSNTVTATTLAASPESGRILADAYVRGGQYAGTNYGRATELITKFSGTAQYLRESIMKLDISSVQPGNAVRLRVFGRLSDTRAPSVTSTIYLASSTSWTETGVTWNTKPLAQTAWTTVTVSGTTAAWYEVDLTTQVQERRSAGQTMIAIALKNTVDTLPYVTFSSRETSNAPQLVVGTSSAAVAAPTADTYVRSGQYASANYGAATELIAKFSSDPQYMREAYLKFDISDIQPDDDVRLRLFGRLSDTRASSVTTSIYPLTDSTWAETSVTWNTQPPAASTAWGSVTVSGTASRWYEVDLTEEIQAIRAAGATVLAAALQNTVDSLPYVSFSSRESANPPQLVIAQ
jgi:phosphatidylserine/phosphatidylglycerophosphate/cardiolipin synthase-like enzyme